MTPLTCPDFQDNSHPVYWRSKTSSITAEDGARGSNCSKSLSREFRIFASHRLGLTLVPQFPNMEHLDFSDLEDKNPVQEFTIPQGREVGEYHVMCVSRGFLQSPRSVCPNRDDIQASEIPERDVNNVVLPSFARSRHDPHILRRFPRTMERSRCYLLLDYRPGRLT